MKVVIGPVRWLSKERLLAMQAWPECDLQDSKKGERSSLIPQSCPLPCHLHAMAYTPMHTQHVK